MVGFLCRRGVLRSYSSLLRIPRDAGQSDRRVFNITTRTTTNSPHSDFLFFRTHHQLPTTMAQRRSLSTNNPPPTNGSANHDSDEEHNHSHSHSHSLFHSHSHDGGADNIMATLQETSAWHIKNETPLGELTRRRRSWKPSHNHWFTVQHWAHRCERCRRVVFAFCFITGRRWSLSEWCVPSR